VWSLTDTPVARVRGPGTYTLAFTSNRDPIGITWNSISNRTVTYDLSQVAIEIGTKGLGTSATGFLELDGKYIDGTTNVNLPESSAIPFFSLMLPFSSINGAAPVLLTEAFSLSAAGTITDSLGDSGDKAVANGLLGDLTPNNGTFEFAQPFTSTVGLPGTDSQSLLFTYESTLAAVSVVPEPSAIVLLGVGILGLAAFMWSKSRRGGLMAPAQINVQA
jgi:hypothetical protein